MSETWTIRRVLLWTAERFQKLGIDSPRLTAEVLLSHALTLDRVRLYVDFDRPLSKPELTQIRDLVARRCTREPTQYITGYREFYSRKLKVDDRVLIPRPETETLIDVVRPLLDGTRPIVVLDLCTGSGCIAVTLAAEMPLATVYATDISDAALAVARENAVEMNVVDRIHFLLGDLFAPLPDNLLFDAIVSNPPYIATGELGTLQPEVQREPRVALDGGADGLKVVQAIAGHAMKRLKPGGFLAMEIGETQGARVGTMLRDFGYRNSRIEKDLARLDRLAVGQAASLETHVSL